MNSLFVASTIKNFFDIMLYLYLYIYLYSFIRVSLSLSLSLCYMYVLEHSLTLSLVHPPLSFSRDREKVVLPTID